MNIVWIILLAIGLIIVTLVVATIILIIYGSWKMFSPWILAKFGIKCKHHKSRQAVRTDTGVDTDEDGGHKHSLKGGTIYYICTGCLSGYHIDYETVEQLLEIKMDPYKYYKERTIDVKPVC